MMTTPHSRLLLALTTLVLASACGRDSATTAPAVDVEVGAAETMDVPVTMEWIGTTEGAVDAEIRAQVSGYLISQDYKEGTLVKQGALLFQIDPRPFQAALEQARGDLGRAQALLEKTRLDVERYTPLEEEGAVSRQELDNAVQANRGAQASVQTARAAVDKAKLDLSFTEIRSPINGIAGVARGQLGDLVGPADPQPLTDVSQVDPIRVSFPLSEREYLRFEKAFRGAVEGADSKPSEARLELILTDGSVWPQRGRAVPAAAGVDPRTGTILVRGEFPNPDRVLRPGQYARVRAVVDVEKNAVVVPQRAISELQGVFQVAVVNADNQVAMRVVETGPRYESDQVIKKGLKAGERVVVEGLQKVRDGVVVNPLPAVAAGAASAE